MDTVSKSVWEKLQYERRDLWLGPAGELGAAHQFFNGLYLKDKSTTKWADWQKSNLRRLQDVLLDRMEKERLELIAIRPHAKDAVEKDWPTLSRREAELTFSMGGNVGVKCGPTFNLLIVDLDPTDTLPDFWKRIGTLTTRTGQGYHQYFRYRRNINEHTGDRIYDLLCSSIGHRRLYKPHCCGSTIRYGSGHGSYALVPMSIHPNAAIYKFVDHKAPIVSFTKVLENLGERTLD